MCPTLRPKRAKGWATPQAHSGVSRWTSRARRQRVSRWRRKRLMVFPFARDTCPSAVVSATDSRVRVLVSVICVSHPSPEAGERVGHPSKRAEGWAILHLLRQGLHVHEVLRQGDDRQGQQCEDGAQHGDGIVPQEARSAKPAGRD